ncbi:MAG: DegT/DnrJ/EryC1/StrS family aminotransferase, partial [Syntrophales bacterium]
RTKAIIVPHLFGLPADIRRIAALGVPVVEDCAQSLGSRLAGAPTGSFGRLSVFSFYATKVICTGEGGMIASRDAGLLERIRDLRDYDEKPDDRTRYNYKMTDLQAAMGIVQLRKLPDFITRRLAIASRYDDVMNECGIPTPASLLDREGIPYRYVIRTDRLESILAAGRDAGISCRRPVFKPLHRYLGLNGYPHTDSAFASALSIPIYPSLGDADIEAILDSLQSLLSKKQR